VGAVLDSITPDLADWLRQQHVFFVATAPLAGDGLVNCSPKGMDTFRILGPRQVAYLDLTGSGVETIAHLRENGRIVLMFCAFEGPPKIIRFHGQGGVHVPDTREHDELRPQFPDCAGARAIIVVDVERIGSSCGYSVPRMEFTDDRDALVKWAQGKGTDGLRDYRSKKNARSIDGLPGLDPR
jgi:hypothetical protein